MNRLVRDVSVFRGQLTWTNFILSLISDLKNVIPYPFQTYALKKIEFMCHRQAREKTKSGNVDAETSHGHFKDLLSQVTKTSKSPIVIVIEIFKSQ